ncbi:MAG TPA: DUF4173 domain-containing protein [Candidatus Dojkabacteria bacterium]|nr:DUF4173 domain-containing protein [Candidatus Dojkabacteria bacterium]
MSKRAYGILGVSIGLSFLSLILFYKTGLGINLAIYSFFIAVIILIIAKVFKRISKSLVINSILLVVISIPFSITSALPVLIVLNILWFYHLIITIDSFTRITSSFGLIDYIFTPIIQIVTAVLAPFSLLIKTKRNEKDLLNTIMRILIGAVVAIPIIVLFTYLLMSADLVFKDLIEKNIGINILKEIFTIFMWFTGVAWVLLGALYHTLYKKKQYEPTTNIQPASSSLFIESTTILVIVEFLFLVFNIIQITYLFGGSKLITGGDYSYSEYARKGFFELVTVSVIAMFLIGILAKIKRTTTNMQSLIFKIVSVTGLVMLIPMAVSAFYRLMMYEQEYGFTRLRLYSHLFIIYLIVILIWLGIKLTTHLRESKFLYVLYLFTIISLAIFALINVDGTIARLNIQKYKKDVTENKEIKLDIAYLSSLSYDAVDEIMNYYNEASDDDKKEIAFYMKPVKDRLEFEESGIDLRAFNFRRFKAKNRLKNEYLPNVSGVNSIDFYSQQVEDERKEKIISDYAEQYCNEIQEGYYPTDEYLCNFEDYDFFING